MTRTISIDPSPKLREEEDISQLDQICSSVSPMARAEEASVRVLVEEA